MACIPATARSPVVHRRDCAIAPATLVLPWPWTMDVFIYSHFGITLTLSRIGKQGGIFRLQSGNSFAYLME